MMLTEKDAALAYAIAWNRLNCSEFLELLADDAHYASQMVFDELKNKEEISDYFTNKIETVKADSAEVYAELGITRAGYIGRDCVCLAQGDKDIIQAAVIFDVDGSKIQRYDLCMPELIEVERSGIYPI